MYFKNLAVIISRRHQLVKSDHVFITLRAKLSGGVLLSVLSVCLQRAGGVCLCDCGSINLPR